MRPKYQIDLYAGCPNDLLSLSFGAPKGLHLKKYIYQYFIHTGKAQKADLSKINNIFPKLAFFLISSSKRRLFLHALAVRY